MSEASTQAALGIDIGGSYCRVGVVTSRGEILSLVELPTPAGGEPADLARQIAACALEAGEADLSSDGRSRDRRRPGHPEEPLDSARGKLPNDGSGRGAGTLHTRAQIPPPFGRRNDGATPPSRYTLTARFGIALPGIWDRDTTIMRKALNLPRLEGVNLRELFEQALGRPVVLETDVNAAAWAQYEYLKWCSAVSEAESTGAQPASESASVLPARYVYLSVGTGIGGAVIINGELVRHTRGGAGHFGHLIVDTSPDAPLCRCGARGCLEAVASGAALERVLRDRFAASHRAGRVPQPVAYDNAVRALATALLDLANVYAPDVIALGGGVVDHHAGMATDVANAFHKLGCTLPPRALRIEQAHLATREAGVIGAALLALQGGAQVRAPLPV